MASGRNTIPHLTLTLEFLTLSYLSLAVMWCVRGWSRVASATSDSGRWSELFELSAHPELELLTPILHRVQLDRCTFVRPLLGRSLLRKLCVSFDAPQSLSSLSIGPAFAMSEPLDDAAAQPVTDVEMVENAGAEGATGEDAAGEDNTMNPDETDGMPFAQEEVEQPTTFMSYLASPIVTLIVGNESQTTLSAHQALLCKSPYFKTICDAFTEPASVRFDRPKECASSYAASALLS